LIMMSSHSVWMVFKRKERHISGRNAANECGVSG
jgi:hypothetical protein